MTSQSRGEKRLRELLQKSEERADRAAKRLKRIQEELREQTAKLQTAEEKIQFLLPRFDCFWYFQRLPRELRLMIWDIVSKEDERPRDVVLQFSHPDHVDRQPFARIRHPILLSINRESRAICLVRYSLAFRFVSDMRPGQLSGIPFDFNRDTLVLGTRPSFAKLTSWWSRNILYRGDFNHVIRLTLLRSTFLASKNLELVHFFGHFPALKTLFLLHGSVPRDRAPGPRKLPYTSWPTITSSTQRDAETKLKEVFDLAERCREQAEKDAQFDRRGNRKARLRTSPDRLPNGLKIDEITSI